MSKTRLEFSAVMDTIDHANLLLSSLSSQLVTTNLFNIDEMKVFQDDAGSIKIAVDARFNNRDDRDLIYSWLTDNLISNVNIGNWVQGRPMIKTHLCTHDDSIIQDCTRTEHVIWVRP